jgi:hypothetical protein
MVMDLSLRRVRFGKQSRSQDGAVETNSSDAKP